jgi:ribonuclease VapC
MIVDTSAVIAILRAEPDAELYSDAISDAAVARISSANWLETCIVIDAARNPGLSVQLDAFMIQAGMDVVSMTHEHARIARQAYRDFGKGSGSPAQLNYGDCFSFALALSTGEPLLWKGNDFTHTGLPSALEEES